MLQIALVLIVCCLALLILVLVGLLVKKRRLKLHLLKSIADLQESINGYKERFDLVEPHAADYMNSLGAEGSRMVLKLRNIISSLERLIVELSGLVATRDLGAYIEARQLLEMAFHPDFRGTDDRGFVSLSYESLTPRWEEEVEELLQRVGQEIAKASIRAEEVGIPKRRKRQPTLLSLYKARIRPNDSRSDW